MIQALAYVLPAYVASPLATLARFLPTHPMDFGKRWRDGERILGDGKTWEGFILGTVGGGAIGLFVYPLFSVQYNPFLVALVSMLGDVAGSFVKRRMGLKRGEDAPLIDQIDFLLPVLALFPPRPTDALILILITPLIHRLACIIGHALGVKREPW